MFTVPGELLKKEEVTAFCLCPVQCLPGLAESRKSSSQESEVGDPENIEQVRNKRQSRHEI